MEDLDSHYILMSSAFLQVPIQQGLDTSEVVKVHVCV